jgi:hypothetical protein
MKILMTGMSSSHCSIGENVTFFSSLYSVLSEIADVTVRDPKISWTKENLDVYDYVFVGVTPITSISANKLYGSLAVLNHLYESTKLRLIVDSPQIWQYKNSLESFKKNPDQIYKELHKNRKDYLAASTTYRENAYSLAQKMTNLRWPKTYVPLLPWGTSSTAAASLRFIPEDSLVGLKIDSIHLDKQLLSVSRLEQWAVDNLKSKWWSELLSFIRFPGVSTLVGRGLDDSYSGKVISESTGLIIPPQDRKVGTWWSYRYAQALNNNTPIVTYWQDTIGFDDSWAVLAYQVEDMKNYERQALSAAQWKSYVRELPTRDALIDTILKDLIGSN